MLPHALLQMKSRIWRCRMHGGNVHSLQCHQERMRQSWCCKQDRDSSEYTTSPHSYFQVCRWTHHSKRSCLWCSVKSNRSNGHKTGCPYCCKHCRTVRVGTCCLANDPIYWLKARNLAVRSIETIWIRCLSFRLLVITGLWDPERRSVWPSWFHWFHILGIMGSRSTRKVVP